MKSNDATEAPSMRELAALLGSMLRIGLRDRALIVQLLRRLIEQHPAILGIWCLFEPGILGPDDQDYASQPGHDDSGRFIPRWHRYDGTLRLSANFGYNSPKFGGWYLRTRECREEIVFGPYDEQLLSGFAVLSLSRVAPILERDLFLGAVGMDIAVDSLAPHPGAAQQDSPLEKLFERWHIFLDERSRIVHASRHARRLLARYAGPCGRNEIPESLRHMLAASKSPPETTLRKGPGQLCIRAVRHPHTAQRILSLEERTRAVSEPILSDREREVFRWLEQGKTNAEIAIILGISGHTVRHHLESIFAKLGVENRRAAIRFGRRALRSTRTRPVSFVPDL